MTHDATTPSARLRPQTRKAAAGAARIAWASTLALSCAPALAASLHIDSFDAGIQGWTGGAAPTFVPSGGAGDGGGFLRISNIGSNLATYNFDQRWTGDYAALGAARVRADLMAPVDSDPLAIRIVLFGPDTVQQRWTSAAAQDVPNDGVWRRYEFSLRAEDLVTPFPVDATHAQLMNSVQRIMLRHDPGDPDFGGTGVVGALGIDNVELAPSAPPPDIPGDFDGDRDVDADDLNDLTAGWRGRYGVDLDGHNFLDWQRHLGETAASGAAMASAPEPPALRLILILAAAALGQCRPCIPNGRR